MDAKTEARSCPVLERDTAKLTSEFSRRLRLLSLALGTAANTVITSSNTAFAGEPHASANFAGGSSTSQRGAASQPRRAVNGFTISWIHDELEKLAAHPAAAADASGTHSDTNRSVMPLVFTPEVLKVMAIRTKPLGDPLTRAPDSFPTNSYWLATVYSGALQRLLRDVVAAGGANSGLESHRLFVRPNDPADAEFKRIYDLQQTLLRREILKAVAEAAPAGGHNAPARGPDSQLTQQQLPWFSSTVNDWGAIQVALFDCARSRYRGGMPPDLRLQFRSIAASLGRAITTVDNRRTQPIDADTR